jgi:hypothetical protein
MGQGPYISDYTKYVDLKLCELKAYSPPESPGIAEFRVIPVDSVDSGRNSGNSVDSGWNQWGNEMYCIVGNYSVLIYNSGHYRWNRLLLSQRERKEEE